MLLCKKIKLEVMERREREKEMYTIYVLDDQRFTGLQAVRYVGITDDVYQRFAQHLRCDGSHREKDEWIQSLKAEQIMLVMRTVQVVETLEEARTGEQRWIQHYLSQGAALLNRQITSSFSFDDFQRIMKGLPKEAKLSNSIQGKITKIPTSDCRLLGKSEAIKRVQRILRRNPNTGPTELAEKAGVSRSYASLIKSQFLATLAAEQSA